MDMVSYAKSNHLVGNPRGLAVLEIIGPGAIFEILVDSYITFVGACAEIFTGEQKLPQNVVIPLSAGQQISIGRFIKGGILYLAVQGGIAAPVVMGSRSTMPYFSGSIPVKGTVYTIDEQETPVAGLVQITGGIDNFKDEQPIEVLKGPEYDWLHEDSKKVLETAETTITNQSNRMGFRLQGPSLQKAEFREMLTSAVLPGTMQLLPDGQMIALMRDAQTTG
jgi:allophanate hydrolase subunit 2